MSWQTNGCQRASTAGRRPQPIGRRRNAAGRKHHHRAAPRRVGLSPPRAISDWSRAPPACSEKSIGRTKSRTSGARISTALVSTTKSGRTFSHQPGNHHARRARHRGGWRRRRPARSGMPRQRRLVVAHVERQRTHRRLPEALARAADSAGCRHRGASASGWPVARSTNRISLRLTADRSAPRS